MNNKVFRILSTLSLVFLLCGAVFGDRRSYIYKLGIGLEEQANSLAQNSYEHFKGWSGEISDQEQAILFKSEDFSASCRLFLRLTEERSGYFNSEYLRTNIYNAFIYLVRAFEDLEEEMRKGGIMPYALRECRNILERIDREFSQWPSADNLAYLHQKYVKVRDVTVYMIERKGPGDYVRRAFKNLESIFRYNYDLKRGKDPWQYLSEVSNETLEKMPEGSMIDLTFEGSLVIEQSNRPNRPVYLIENNKKRGITSPSVLMRFGGWSKVYEIPAEVINKYSEGEPIT